MDLKFTKPKTWQGNDLKGEWLVTVKADGVRAFYNEPGKWFSRAGKPLYNMPPLPTPCPPQGYEVYVKLHTSSKDNYKETISRVRSSTKQYYIGYEHLYVLDPIDIRLQRRVFVDPTAQQIRDEMEHVLKTGWEGLILRQGDKWLKVKPVETYDVLVTGVIPGTGKHTGRMGALMTDMGRVGTGFTDSEREEIWNIGDMIEVSCMQLTPDGKFRHPAFERRRFDK